MLAHISVPLPQSRFNIIKHCGPSAPSKGGPDRALMLSQRHAPHCKSRQPAQCWELSPSNTFSVGTGYRTEGCYFSFLIFFSFPFLCVPFHFFSFFFSLNSWGKNSRGKKKDTLLIRAPAFYVLSAGHVTVAEWQSKVICPKLPKGLKGHKRT